MVATKGYGFTRGNIQEAKVSKSPAFCGMWAQTTTLHTILLVFTHIQHPGKSATQVSQD